MTGGFVNRQLISGQFIFMQWRNERLSRISDPITLFGQEFVPKKESGSDLTISQFFKKLFPAESHSSEWKILRDGNAFPR